tara:strand:+ start:2556 stop:4052 length:1497 start_codon:yes stop_codon:yes gene_type:complete
MEQYFLTIDKGSTNIKVALFNGALEQVYVAGAPNVNLSPSEGAREFDLVVTWQHACELVRQVVTEFCKPEQIKAVSFSAHGNGLVALDSNKNPVMNGVYSLDSRATAIIAQWQQQGLVEQAVAVTRFPFGSGSVMPLYAWLKQEQPELHAITAHVLLTKDWFRYCFTSELATDYTDGSGASILDFDQQAYATDIFNLLGIGDLSEKLPPLKNSTDSAGVVTDKAAQQCGLLAGTPVFIGSHDTCATPLGIGDSSAEVLVSAFGTWAISTVNAHSTEGLPVLLNSAIKGQYLTGIGDGNAGAALDTMLSSFFQDYLNDSDGQSIYQRIEREIRPADRNELLFLPHVFGNALNPSATVQMYGLNFHTERKEILKAIIEGILLGYCFNIGLFDLLKNITKIWLTGGGSRSNIIGQIMADIFQCDVFVPVDYEMSARGAAVCAQIGLGEIKRLEEAEPPRVRRQFVHDPSMAGYYESKLQLFTKATTESSQISTSLTGLKKG